MTAQTHSGLSKETIKKGRWVPNSRVFQTHYTIGIDDVYTKASCSKDKRTYDKFLRDMASNMASSSLTNKQPPNGVHCALDEERSPPESMDRRRLLSIPPHFPPHSAPPLGCRIFPSSAYSYGFTGRGGGGGGGGGGADEKGIQTDGIYNVFQHDRWLSSPDMFIAAPPKSRPFVDLDAFSEGLHSDCDALMSQTRKTTRHLPKATRRTTKEPSHACMIILSIPFTGWSTWTSILSTRKKSSRRQSMDQGRLVSTSFGNPGCPLLVSEGVTPHDGSEVVRCTTALQKAGSRNSSRTNGVHALPLSVLRSASKTRKLSFFGERKMECRVDSVSCCQSEGGPESDTPLRNVQYVGGEYSLAGLLDLVESGTFEVASSSRLIDDVAVLIRKPLPNAINVLQHGGPSSSSSLRLHSRTSLYTHMEWVPDSSPYLPCSRVRNLRDRGQPDREGFLAIQARQGKDGERGEASEEKEQRTIAWTAVG
ncbi:uncharacterized protein EV422DRAFT_578107 [Fimicolochytrium jonesii]|uniref:uncharacterized protein n=1 Tax=Fimicolochytrium jonesii TaxID=1396493 RepID=UPI0022FE8926|nr:uncharacterized protein EV422DRAFT_578107 [Fimicolochytrium jonesii]KAI8821839.1 hypothetical protein EV422DRAFT_578107 [Fimicolochytrium jonesii]